MTSINFPNQDSLVMLSGGMESVILMSLLKKHLTSSRLAALFVNVGQYSAERQLAYAKRLCSRFGVHLEYVDIHNFRDLLIAYAEPPYEMISEGGDDHTVPRGSCEIQVLAGLYAVYHKYDCVYYSGTKSDSNRVPNLPELIATAEKLIRLNTEIPISFKAPFLNLLDEDVLKLGIQEGVDIAESWSCNWGKRYHCGLCERCQKRMSVFKMLDISDPTIYENDINAAVKRTGVKL